MCGLILCRSSNAVLSFARWPPPHAAWLWLAVSLRVSASGITCQRAYRRGEPILQANDATARAERTAAAAEQQRTASDAAAKDAAAQLRAARARDAAADAAARSKQAELEEASASLLDTREALHAAHRRHMELQADSRKLGGEVAALTARLGVQTALSESRDVEIEELKAALERAGSEREATGDALGSSVGEAKRLRGEIARLQGGLKAQVRSLGLSLLSRRSKHMSQLHICRMHDGLCNDM